MNNILIVESENDKYFIEAFLEYLKLSVNIDAPICAINDYECLGGIDALKSKLNQLTGRIKKDNIKKVGIIIDADDKGIDERIQFINTHLKEICSDVNVTQMNKIEHSHEQDVDFVCCITHVAGYGELETLLKIIKSEDSPYADCLDAWRKCLIASGKEDISDKEFDKFWVSNYLKFDTCISSKHRGKKSKYCANELINHSNDCDEIKNTLNTNSETITKKDIWNFEHEALTDLKNFLLLLS
ncbi:MAG: hypothetical protein NTY39_07290 [Campylobacterales bacterium]|nr:hypothetical protein [Campylobacterales bacterium]